MNVKIDWLKESKKFDRVADIYNDNRPGYPEEIMEKLIGYSDLGVNSELLEIGSGTGLGTDYFANKEYKVTCIEQGKNLIEVAKAKYTQLPLRDNGEERIRFVCTPFQDWENEIEVYDTAFSAQAFHWIPKPLGYKKIAKALKENGTLNVFWNKYIQIDSDQSREIAKLLREYNLLFIMDDTEYKTFKNRTSDSIETTDLFKDIEISEVPWQKSYNYEDLIAFLKTGNKYLDLESQEVDDLDVRLMDIFSRNDYMIQLNFTCVLFSARKI